MKKHILFLWFILCVLGVDAQIFNDSRYSEDLAIVCSSVNTKEIRKIKILIKEFYGDSDDENCDILNKFCSTFHPMNDSVWKETCSHVEMAGDYYFIIKDSSIQEYDFINNCKSNNSGFIKCAEAKDSLSFKVIDYYNTIYYYHDTLWKHSITKTDVDGKVLLKNEYTYNKKHNYNQHSVTHDSLGYKVTDYYYNDSIYKGYNRAHTVIKYNSIGSRLYYKNISFSNKRIYYTLFLDNDSSKIFKLLDYYDGKLNRLSISQEYKPVYLNNHDFTVKRVEKDINLSPKPSYIKSYNTKTKHFIYDKHNRLTSIETIETNDETKQILTRTILKFKYYKRKRLFGLL
jgi:hypothetical protein